MKKNVVFWIGVKNEKYSEKYGGGNWGMFFQIFLTNSENTNYDKEEFGTYNFLEISFVLKKEYQNFGIGTNLLKEMIKLVIKFNQSWEMAISHDIIHARYKSGNISSKKVFEKNNFIEHKYDGKNKSVIRTWKLLNESDHSLFEEYVNNINSRKKFIENTKKELFNNILKLGDKNE